MQLSQRLTEQPRCKVILIMFLYKAVMLQTTFFDSSLSSSGHIL